MPRQVLLPRTIIEEAIAELDALPQSVAERSPHIDRLRRYFRAVRQDVLAEVTWEEIIDKYITAPKIRRPHKRTVRRLYVALAKAYGLNPDRASLLEAHFELVRAALKKNEPWDKLAARIFAKSPGKKPSRREYERTCEAYGLQP